MHGGFQCQGGALNSQATAVSLKFTHGGQVGWTIICVSITARLRPSFAGASAVHFLPAHGKACKRAGQSGQHELLSPLLGLLNSKLLLTLPSDRNCFGCTFVQLRIAPQNPKTPNKKLRLFNKMQNNKVSLQSIYLIELFLRLSISI